MAFILWDLHIDRETKMYSLRTLVLTAGIGELTFALSRLLRELR